MLYTISRLTLFWSTSISSGTFSDFLIRSPKMPTTLLSSAISGFSCNRKRCLFSNLYQNIFRAKFFILSSISAKVHRSGEKWGKYINWFKWMQTKWSDNLTFEITPFQNFLYNMVLMIYYFSGARKIHQFERFISTISLVWLIERVIQICWRNILVF